MNLKVTSQINRFLHEAIPDNLVYSSYREAITRDLSQETPEVIPHTFEVIFDEEETERLHIPVNAPISILTRVFVEDYTDDLNFGVYRVQIGVGKTENKGNGVIIARYCFATLYFDEECKAITVDFYKYMR